MRRHNGAATRISKPEILDKLRLRLNAASDGGGQWTTAKVAELLARELGLEKVAIQRGCEALKTSDVSIQAPRPKNPKSAKSEEEAAFKNVPGTLRVRPKTSCGIAWFSEHKAN